jgi:hypothetical protein
MLKRYRWSSRVGVGCSLVLLLSLLVACGSTYSGQGGQPQVKATQETQNCGSIHTLHSQVVQADSSKVKQVEDCFSQAYQQCRPATLTFSVSGVDAGTLHTFSLKSVGGTCVISDITQHFIVPRSSSAATTYTCESLTMQTDGLHILSCGKLGSIVIPTATTQ